ncbi:MAG: hypothetical protein IPG94_26025 [Kineosporiaceae bacterium]|nr:hypothetical protein [Kineosporiaceae bacterium]
MEQTIWELRVHGVSNTPPSSVLRTWSPGAAGAGDSLAHGRVPATPVPAAEPVLVRVAGDAVTGFYRHPDTVPTASTLPTPPTLPVAGSQPGDVRAGAARYVVEAFSWGQLTSGQRDLAAKDLRRAGWSALLPFALVNVALWSRPRVPGPAAPAKTEAHGDGGHDQGTPPSEEPREAATTALLAWTVRALALSLTATLLIAVSAASMDLVGWQCGAACSRQVPFLSTVFIDDYFAVGEHRALLMTLVPLAVLAAVWWLAGKSIGYESVVPAASVRSDLAARDAAEPVADEPVERTAFEHASFWSGEDQVRALRRIHLGAGLGSVAFLLAACVRSDAATWSGQASVLSQLLAAVALLVALGLLWLPVVRVRNGGVPAWQLWLSWIPAGVATVSVLLAALAAHAATPSAGPSSAVGAQPGLDASVRGLYAVQVVLLGIMVVLTWWEAHAAGRREGLDQPAWSGLATPVFAGLGWILGWLYSIAVLFGVQAWLDGGSRGARRRPEFPVTMQWSAVGLAVGAVLALITAVVAAIALARVRSTARRDLLSKVPATNRHARVRARDVAAARGLHRFVGFIGLTVLGWFAVLTVPVIVAGAAVTVCRAPMTVCQAVPRWGVWYDVLTWFGWPDTPRPAVVVIGAKLAVLLLGGLTLVIGLTYRKPTFRRSLGVLWDIATFWPRGAHPFAPPCYAERAVPQLVTRIEAFERTPLVLAGHSQGSLLCAATIAQLSPQRRQHVALLTMGTQLTRLYGRTFPAFFGRDARERLAEMLGGDRRHGWSGVRWRSLHRDTDYLGWPISGSAMSGELVGELDVAIGGRPDEDALGRVVDRGVLDPCDLNPRDGSGLRPNPPGEVVDPPIRGHSDYPMSPTFIEVRDELVKMLPDGAASWPAPASPVRWMVREGRDVALAAPSGIPAPVRGQPPPFG